MALRNEVIVVFFDVFVEPDIEFLQDANILPITINLFQFCHNRQISETIMRKSSHVISFMIVLIMYVGLAGRAGGKSGGQVVWADQSARRVREVACALIGWAEFVLV